MWTNVRQRWQRVRALIRKEFIRLLRDRRTLALIVAMPLIELFLFAYAVDMTVDHLPMVVADHSRDAESYALVDALVVSNYFDLVRYVENEDAALQAIDAGEVKVGLVIPPAFAAQLERGDAQALMMLDGSDSFSVNSGYSAALAIAQARGTTSPPGGQDPAPQEGLLQLDEQEQRRAEGEHPPPLLGAQPGDPEQGLQRRGVGERPLEEHEDGHGEQRRPAAEQAPHAERGLADVAGVEEVDKLADDEGVDGHRAGELLAHPLPLHVGEALFEEAANRGPVFHRAAPEIVRRQGTLSFRFARGDRGTGVFGAR